MTHLQSVDGGALAKGSGPPSAPAQRESRPIRVGVFGRGRLGSLVAERLSREEGLELAWALGRGEEPGEGADMALEVSAAEAVGEHLAWALSAGVDLVIGATGWPSGLLEPLRAAPPPLGLMVAPNFSLGAALLRRLALALGRLSAREPGADLGIVERHHRGKADAPSGTARLLAAALAEGSGRHAGWCQGRAEAGRINIASLRAGAGAGYHELRYEGPSETIVVSHEAASREIFAAGAIAALRWLRGRRGLFSFDDMAAEILDPLFLPGAGRP